MAELCGSGKRSKGIEIAKSIWVKPRPFNILSERVWEPDMDCRASHMRRIFHTGTWSSGRGDHPLYPAQWFRRGFLKVTQIQFETIPAPVTRSTEDCPNSLLYCWCLRGGRENHQFLKWQAWHWLASQGSRSIKLEYNNGSRTFYDLFADDIGIVAECGDTDPSRLIYPLLGGGCDKLAVFPFYGGDLYVFEGTEAGRLAFAECDAGVSLPFEKEDFQPWMIS